MVVVGMKSTLSEVEISRIAELKAVLFEADPKAKAQECKLSAGRIKDVATRVDAVLSRSTAGLEMSF